ncbi:MAG TPA: tRNA methyl transferase PRC-barrel domain-containing protein [Acidimicrobiales bacterium]|nr:tRNA methyl transferase PRC-barrel domain-containing protein [Acidimicrobiales bacterium]
MGRGADGAKDQSYVLAGLDHERLGRVLFPVGDSAKGDVRREAAALGLRTAAKPDSQDVCFITRGDGRAHFLGRRLALTPGRVVDGRGRTVGAVPAVEAVTVGQRRGLGLPGGGPPRYALDVDVAGATVRVGTEAEMQVAAQPVAALGWAGPPHEAGRLDEADLAVQASAHGAPTPGRLLPSGTGDGTGEVRWARPRRRVAPGQALVAYDGDHVVAWATAAGPPRRG